jgi:tetratricopeptide (TPR) repeat protein
VQDYVKVLSTYERALAAEVYPTANMNATFLGALVALERYRDAFAFYDRVAKDNRPVSVFFYRQLLFAVSVAQNSALAQRVVDDMKRKGFKMRAEDYLNAIRTFDSKYFVAPRTVQRGKEPEREQLAPPMDRYTTCIERSQERDDDPDAFHELDEASRSVLALFDEAAELVTITSRHGALFPRAITAAVFLEEFERALEIAELYAQVADEKTPPLHFTGVRMTVNAYLMLDRPAEAWEFVKQTYLDGETRQCAPHYANIVDYLCIHDRVPDVLSMVEDARALEMQDLLLSNTVAKTVIPTLCRNVDSIEDNAVWNALVGPKSGFGVLTSPYWCEFFIDHCSRNGRMGLVVRALEKRSKKMVPVIKPRLALHLMTRFEERGELENVTKVFSAMDKERSKINKGSQGIHERVVEVISRVYEKLGMEDASRRLRRKHTPSESSTN